MLTPHCTILATVAGVERWFLPSPSMAVSQVLSSNTRRNSPGSAARSFLSAVHAASS